MKKSAQQNNGFALVAVLAIVLVIAGVLIAYLMLSNRSSVTPTGESPLPPESERVNPEPTSGNSIFVDEVDPGNSVVVNEVNLSIDGYVLVMKDNEGERVEVGKSSLLKAGNHQNVVINTQALKDGDIIYIVLTDDSQKEILDQNGNIIEVQKNVGMVMSHYEYEY